MTRKSGTTQIEPTRGEKRAEADNDEAEAQEEEENPNKWLSAGSNNKTGKSIDALKNWEEEQPESALLEGGKGVEEEENK